MRRRVWTFMRYSGICFVPKPSESEGTNTDQRVCMSVYYVGSTRLARELIDRGLDHRVFAPEMSVAPGIHSDQKTENTRPSLRIAHLIPPLLQLLRKDTSSSSCRVFSSYFKRSVRLNQPGHRATTMVMSYDGRHSYSGPRSSPLKLPC